LFRRFDDDIVASGVFFMQPQPEKIADWAELVRRFQALPESRSTENQDAAASLVSASIPRDDPTGLVEWAEAMRSEHIKRGLDLVKRFPFFESIFCPVLPWKAGYAEAQSAVDNLLKQAFRHLAPLKRGEQYEIFCDAAGEVTAFHFPDVEARAAFRQAVGLSPNGGFEEFCGTFG
jgi:hypothetical protein